MKIDDHENYHKSALSIANLEQNIGYEPMAEEEIKGLDTRVNITVTSYRKANHDPDGVSCKAVLDGIVRAGILPDDSAKEIASITFKSVKSQDEKTVIEIVSL